LTLIDLFTRGIDSETRRGSMGNAVGLDEIATKTLTIIPKTDDLGPARVLSM